MTALNFGQIIKKLGIKKAISWFSKLSARERLLVGAAVIGATGFLVFITGEAFVETLEDYQRITVVRTRDYNDISNLLQRYRLLNTRLGKLKASFSESQMTFEQVTAGLDKIVNQALGEESKYDLKKTQNAETFGEEFEKQDFTLKVNSISLDQLVRLLYELEHGDSPLFMGKVDINQNKRDKTFRATVEITTIGKRRAV